MTSLRLHVAGGRVWVGRDGRVGGDGGLSVRDFLAPTSPAADDASVVRLLGVRGNAALVCRLHERRTVRHLGQRIELASPALLPTARQREVPAAVLHCLLQPHQHQLACGGIHDMTAYDFPSYFMMAAVDDPDGTGESATRAMSYHPAWPALSFLPHLDVLAAVDLLCDVVDPRWFRNPFRPHRINKLLNFLGVTPANMRAVTAGAKSGRNLARAERLVRTWFGGDLYRRQQAPNNFLYRVFTACADPASGLLRACRRFVRFVYEVWMSFVSAKVQECGFMPRRFFKDAAESAAFEEHCRGLR
jgi:hypothetical protein